MTFNNYNLFGAAVVLLIILPQLFYNRKHPYVNHCTNKYLNILDKVSTIGCYILMIVPILVGEFKFATVYEQLGYIAGTVILTGSYLMFWYAHNKQATIETTMVLVYTQIGIYFMDGFMLSHWLLVGFSIVFGICDGYIKNYNYYYGKQRIY